MSESFLHLPYLHMGIYVLFSFGENVLDLKWNSILIVVREVCFIGCKLIIVSDQEVPLRIFLSFGPQLVA